MPERVREPSLAMLSPRGFVIDRSLYVGRAGFGGAIDEMAGFLDEEFDPRGGQANVGRARLFRLAGYGFVHEEWSALHMKSGNAAQVPQLARA